MEENLKYIGMDDAAMLQSQDFCAEKESNKFHNFPSLTGEVSEIFHSGYDQ